LIPSLLLALAFAPECRAQLETNRTITVQTDDALRRNQPHPPNLQPSRWTTDIVRLVQSGIDESVLVAFVRTSGQFNLTSDQIVFLNELGLSWQVIDAMLEHDLRLASIQTSPVARSEPGSNHATATNNVVIPVHPGLAVTSGKASLPIENPVAAAPQPTALQPVVPPNSEAATLSGPIEPRLVTQKKKLLYPVREPYPVELTAPILVLQTPSF